MRIDPNSRTAKRMKALSKSKGMKSSMSRRSGVTKPTSKPSTFILDPSRLPADYRPAPGATKPTGKPAPTTIGRPAPGATKPKQPTGLRKPTSNPTGVKKVSYANPALTKQTQPKKNVARTAARRASNATRRANRTTGPRNMNRT